eukprot:CAMPEP_0201507444 /NCGR_PEP_ID=MMETSP0161_2-20130828/1103_1 /ASSEMBLY_ACC=CAM_ASM_000251 /TAXON_ID=180227 /ORGANISM="Neoparamoeba aestuarina, Strain SoJaBio B1-5/56/2" /LENGTH=148 /DNA_ID=CAMNT_0047901805 /DNA_START=158 /DNA_END=604 /DNA_ORIENTATION=+
MKKNNFEHRQVNKATDVLSLSPHLDLVTLPGEQPFIPEFCGRTDLGLLMIAPQYVVETHPKLAAEEEKYTNNVSHGPGRPSKKKVTSWEDASPLHKHLVYLMAHGTCHLLGYEHDEDAQYRSMRAKEVHIMRFLKNQKLSNNQGDIMV